MIQPLLWDAPVRPDVEAGAVFFRCPACRHTWHGATLVEGAWWAAGLTPKKLAKVPYCVRCQQPPPMEVV